ncbi:MAG: transglutaminase-like domain-containing protein [Planctomycetota bacterium]
MRIRCFLWVCLFSAAVAGSKPALGETEYFAVYMEGKKVGYAIQSRTVAEGKVTTIADASITMSRAGVPVTMKTRETSIETTDGKPLAFESLQDWGIMTMKVTGSVNAGMVDVTTALMGGEQKSSLEWPSGAVMAEGLRLMQLEKGLKEGQKYTAKVFIAGVMQSIESEISVGPKREIDLLGRVVALTEVVTKLNIPMAGEIVSTSYVDENLTAQKTIMPVAGMQVEMIACAKEFALGANDVLEVINKMFLTSPEPLPNVRSVESITYYLRPTSEGVNLKIPATDNQSVQSGEEGMVIVTVKPVAAARGAAFGYKGTDQTILSATKPSRYVQSDRKEIVELARKAVGKTKDAAEAARKIEAFVADYIEDKDLSVGYASAAEVAASKQGDCTEHGVLTAALCRAVGIPAQVVSGVAYVNNWNGLEGFGGHAWTQAYVGDKWVGLDAAFKGTGRGGYDAGHITLAAGNGDPEDFFSLLGSIGQFTIEKVIVGN